MLWEWNENQQDLKSLNYAAKASWRSVRKPLKNWDLKNYPEHALQTVPIGSMGRFVYLPTWMVDFCGINAGKSSSPMDPMGLIFSIQATSICLGSLRKYLEKQTTKPHSRYNLPSQNRGKIFQLGEFVGTAQTTKKAGTFQTSSDSPWPPQKKKTWLLPRLVLQANIRKTGGQGSETKTGSWDKIPPTNQQMPGDSKWPFYPLVEGHDSPLKRSLNHPKKVTKNWQVMIFRSGWSNPKTIS